MGVGLAGVPQLLQSLREEKERISDVFHRTCRSVGFEVYLSEHLWKVVDIGGAQGLRLEAL